MFFLEGKQILKPGLEISTRKLAKCEWFFEVASLKKYPLANICKYFSGSKNLYTDLALKGKMAALKSC